MNRIEITIAGPVNSGKTTIAVAIQKFLESKGFNANVVDEEMTDDAMFRLNRDCMTRLHSLPKNSIEVEIKQQMHVTRNYCGKNTVKTED